MSLVYRGDKPLRGFDEDMRDALFQSIAGARHGGVAAAVSSPRLRDGAEEIACNAETNKGVKIECEQILLAIGRESLTLALHVEKPGVELGKRGEVKVDEYSAQVPPYLCRGRRHRPGAIDAGGDPRSHVFCRDRLQEQSHQARPCACAQRGLHHA